MLNIEGTVEDIIYKNDSNGYTVAVLNTSEDDVTIVGYIPFLSVGETLKVEGDWVYHPTYGEQLQVKSLSTVVPATINGIEKYLSSGLIPCVGPKTAKKIVERFGMDSLDIIQYNPQKLKEIEGLGEKKVEKISKAFEEQRDLKDIMVFLQQYDISPSYGLKIYKKYGKDTVKVISENPYRLSEDIFGIGFKISDNIARNMGIDLKSPYRIEAGIKFKLMGYAGNGHSFIPKNILVNETSKLLEVEQELIEESIKDLALKNEVHLEIFDNDTVIYYMPFYKAESNVSKKIIELLRTELDNIDIDVEKEIEGIEKEENICFGKRQKEAIKEAINNGLLVITGGPGTGKTTTINAIIKLFEKEENSIALAAPTGRAAKRLSEATGKEAKTIHRLLEYSFVEKEMAFNKNESSPLDVDVVIIDEVSMVDIILMNNFLKAIVPGTRLILVGDIDQLPSVGPGNVLRDIIQSKIVKVVNLDEIFRQAQESMIIVNAHRINKGENPYLNVKNKDFYFLPVLYTNDIVKTIVSLCQKRLPNFKEYHPLKDIQVLTPMRKGEVGVTSLNKNLQEVINPKDGIKKEKVVGNQVYRVGDKVMQIKNNYSAKWKKIKNERVVKEGEGVFNGDFGFIVNIDEEDEIVKVLFDEEKEVEYDFNDLDELKLAYATTIHKSQGSEFSVVVMPIYWGPPMLLTRNLLYTAITRAKELVVLVGNPKYLYIMIKNNRINKRYSSLDIRMKNILSIF